MQTLLALMASFLFAVGIYLMLRRSLVRTLLGIGLIGHSANLLLFVSGGLALGRAAIVPEGGLVPAPGFADPLPQALVLTAIVIGFGIQAFAAALLSRTHIESGARDTDELREGEA